MINPVWIAATLAVADDILIALFLLYRHRRKRK